MPVFMNCSEVWDLCQICERFISLGPSVKIMRLLTIRIQDIARVVRNSTCFVYRVPYYTKYDVILIGFLSVCLPIYLSVRLSVLIHFLKDSCRFFLQKIKLSTYCSRIRTRSFRLFKCLYTTKLYYIIIIVLIMRPRISYTFVRRFTPYITKGEWPSNLSFCGFRSDSHLGIIFKLFSFPKTGKLSAAMSSATQHAYHKNGRYMENRVSLQ